MTFDLIKRSQFQSISYYWRYRSCVAKFGNTVTLSIFKKTEFFIVSQFQICNVTRLRPHKIGFFSSKKFSLITLLNHSIQKKGEIEIR